VKVTGVDVCPLTGATVDGGWPDPNYYDSRPPLRMLQLCYAQVLQKFSGETQ